MIKWIAATVMVLLSNLAHAEHGVGGGGDVCEANFDHIRSVLAKWIDSDGAAQLEFRRGLSYEEYRFKMESILGGEAVQVSCVVPTLLDPEPIRVGGQPKTCRGTASTLDGKLHIDCDFTRFNQTGIEGQLRIVHHEFASLMDLENNEGSKSDYLISNQIPLIPALFAKAADNPKSPSKEANSCSNFTGVWALSDRADSTRWTIQQHGCQEINVDIVGSESVFIPIDGQFHQIGTMDPENGGFMRRFYFDPKVKGQLVQISYRADETGKLVRGPWKQNLNLEGFFRMDQLSSQEFYIQPDGTLSHPMTEVLKRL